MKNEAINTEFWRHANKFRDELHKRRISRLKRTVKSLEKGRKKSH